MWMALLLAAAADDAADGAWQRHAHTNCYAGAMDLERPRGKPCCFVSNHAECQNKCLETADCTAFTIATSGPPFACYRRTAVDLASCRQDDAGYATWVDPSRLTDPKCAWTKGGKRCGPKSDSSLLWSYCCDPPAPPHPPYEPIYPAEDDPFEAIPRAERRLTSVALDDGSSYAILLADHGLSQKTDVGTKLHNRCPQTCMKGPCTPPDPPDPCLLRPYEDFTVWGTPMTNGPCCQTAVADLIRRKRYELQEEGKKLRFVAAAGDNFYFDGLRNHSDGGSEQWERWKHVYAGLTDVPWLAAFGNHDFGDGDTHATCPEKRPFARVRGQAYASFQLDADKGGYAITSRSRFIILLGTRRGLL